MECRCGKHLLNVIFGEVCVLRKKGPELDLGMSFTETNFWEVLELSFLSVGAWLSQQRVF